MDNNKVQFGLKNAYYAPITEANGIVSYGTPVQIPGTVNISIKASGDAVNFEAEDTIYYENYINNGYEGSLEVARIPDQFRIDILGDTLDTNGALVENSEAKTKKFALMYEFDGDVNKTRHVNYYCSASRPSVEGKTGKKDVSTNTLDFTSRPAPDTSDVKAKVKQGDTGYSTFFSAVYLKNATTNSVTVNTATFSKATGTDLTIDSTSTDVTNSVKNVMVDGVNVYGIYLTVSGADVTIDSVYISTLAVGTHVITVEFVKGNAITVTLTVTA